MAVIAPSVIDLLGDGSTFQVVWTPVTNADSCRPVSYPRHADRAIQVAGTFDSASVAVNGSIDGTNYAALNDPGGTAIAITTAKIKQVLENSVLTQPAATSGSGSQSLTISMLFHLSNTLRT